MAILDYNGVPLDKTQYVRYDDIPADRNRAFTMPLGDDGGTSKDQGQFYDPSKVFVDAAGIQNQPVGAGGIATPGLDEVATLGRKNLWVVVGVIALAAIIFGVIKVK